MNVLFLLSLFPDKEDSMVVASSERPKTSGTKILKRNGDNKRKRKKEKCFQTERSNREEVEKEFTEDLRILQILSRRKHKYREINQKHSRTKET